MSPRNNNQLLATMLNRAASVTFDPIIPAQRAQFNPATGSWVFGLAAFAAGLAINKMIQGEPNSSSAPQSPTPGRDSDRDQSRQFRGAPTSYQDSPRAYQRSSMHDLLHDTMAEESRSGDYLNSLGSEVAKLRAEVAALSAQREQAKYAESEPAQFAEREVSVSDAFKREFEIVRETLDKLNAEKSKLAETESQLKIVLAEQRVNGSGNSELTNKLLSVQNELDTLHSEQGEMQSQYQEIQREASENQSAMEQLKLMLNEKIAKLHEAEAREASLKNDHDVLKETVSSLNGQLEFYREQASQNQGGESSLRILEQSNSKLIEQVNASQMQAEDQQQALQILVAEKSELDSKLAQYQELANASQARMEQLEQALQKAKDAEQSLLSEVEKLSNSQEISRQSEVDSKVASLESELEKAQKSIAKLEQSENDLLQRITSAEQMTTDRSTGDTALLNKIKSERDELLTTLNQAEKRNHDVRTDLDVAAAKEEELNSKIDSLLGEISSIENERDLYKSKSEIDQLKVTNANNEYQALKQSILTLEDERNSLASELEDYQEATRHAQERESQAIEKIKESQNQEQFLIGKIEEIKGNLDSNEQDKRAYLEQQQALQNAEVEIRNLLESKAQKDRELEATRSEMAQLDAHLKRLTDEAGMLAQDEQNSSKQVAIIHEQLKSRDEALVDAREKEAILRREVGHLHQTTTNLQGEIDRLQRIQEEYGASSATLNVLRDTEAQLKAQLEQSNEQIQNLHQGLIKSEQDKAQLELHYGEESNRLNALRMENEELKNKLSQGQAQEAAYSSRIAGLSSNSQQYEELKSEYQRVVQNQQELANKLESAQNQEQYLRQNLQQSDHHLNEVRSERDGLQNSLNEVRSELHRVTIERNELEQTCNKLQLTIADLETQHRQREGQHNEALQQMEYRLKSELAEAGKAIPLTANDTVANQAQRQEHPPKLTTPFETTEISGFAARNEDETNFGTPENEALFQSTKVGRLRKFKGHKKTTDLDAEERQLEKTQKITEHAKDNTSIESLDFTGFDVQDQDTDKQKVYSPNRSFTDLLEDNNRLKKEHKSVDMEAHWSEQDTADNDELIEDSGSLKPLLVGGVAAGLVVGSAIYFLFSGKQLDPAESADPVANNDDGIADNNFSGGGELMPDTTAEENADEAAMEKQEEEILAVLKEFSEANDFGAKSKLTRLPNRSLRDMKIYAASNSQDFTVEDVTVSPQKEVHGGIEFIKAIAKVNEDGQESDKTVYLTRDEQGNLLIDWHTYVNFEVAPWDKYLNFDENKEAQNWNTKVTVEANDHFDYPPEKFESLMVRSSNPDSYKGAYAYLNKENPMYEQLMEVYKNGNNKFILKMRHTGDGSGVLVVDEVISLSEFYLNDVDPTVSSSYGEISFGDSSY